MNAVSLTIDTWLGIIATVLTMTIAIVTAVAFLHHSAMERIVALEADAKDRASATHELALAVTRLSTILGTYEERQQEAMHKIERLQELLSERGPNDQA